MPGTDAGEALRLDRAFDDVLRGEEPRDGADASTVATLRHVYALSLDIQPDPAFIQQLQQALFDGVVSASRVIPTKEESRHNGKERCHLPRFFATAQNQNDTWVELPAGTTLTANGLPRPGSTVDRVAPRSMPHQWWRIAAVLLVIAAIGASLAADRVIRLAPHPAQLSAISVQTERPEPVSLSIPSIGLDAVIERRLPVPEPTNALADLWILNPEVINPGTFVLRKDSALPGEGGNIMLEGRLDHSWSQPEVVWPLQDLASGDLIEIVDANGARSSYAVDWIRRVPIDADQERQDEILGATDAEVLTLITSAGEIDRLRGQAQTVLVVRAQQRSTDGQTTIFSPDPTPCDVAPRTANELDALVLRSKKAAQIPTETPPEALIGQPADPITAAAF